jgi:hypothetical protein
VILPPGSARALDRDSAGPAGPTSSPAALALWLALLAGFSPVLAQFARFEAWFAPPSTLIAPLLIAVCLWRGCAPAEPPRRSGALLIAVGLLLEPIGIAVHTWTIAWLGFPLAAIGLALWLGTPSWRIAVLALGMVPIPDSIRTAGTPAPESALLAGACAAWRALGVAFSCTGPVARLGDRRLLFVSDDIGWTLAPLLAQLGWFAAVNRRASARYALRSALVSAAATAAIAPASIAIALGLLAVSSAAVARAWLAPGVWLVCLVAALLGSRRRAAAA